MHSHANIKKLKIQVFWNVMPCFWPSSSQNFNGL